MQVFVETERLVLRRFTEADVDDLYHLDNDPDVMHFLNGGKPTPREVIERETLPQFLAYYARSAWVSKRVTSAAVTSCSVGSRSRAGSSK